MEPNTAEIASPSPDSNSEIQVVFGRKQLENWWKAMGVTIQTPDPQDESFKIDDVSTWIVREPGDGQLRIKALKIPKNITEIQQITLMRKLQWVVYEGHTYFTPPEKWSITKQYQMTLMSAIHQLMIAMEAPNTPEDVRSDAAHQMGEYWKMYSDMFRELPPKNPDWVKSFLDELIKKEQVTENLVTHCNIERWFATITTQEDIKKLKVVVSQNSASDLRTALFEQGNKEMWQYITLPTQQDRERIANIARANPTQVIAAGNPESFSSGNYQSFLDRTRLHSLLGIAQYKRQLQEIPMWSNKKDIEYRIINQILKTIRTEYPWVNTAEAQDPGKILETKQMLCVGKVSLMHEFLEELGIPHTSIIMNNTWKWNGHIAMTVQMNGEDYLADPTNLQELIPIASRKFNPDTKKTELDFRWFGYPDSSQWSYDQEYLNPERGIMWAILQNHFAHGDTGAWMARLEIWSKDILWHTAYENIGFSKIEAQSYIAAITTKPTGTFQETLLLGKLYWESGDTKKSAETYQNCMKQYPKQTPLWCFSRLIEYSVEMKDTNLMKDSISILIATFGEYNESWKELRAIMLPWKARDMITYISAIKNVDDNWEYNLSIWEKLNIRKSLFLWQYTSLATYITGKIS